MLFNYLGFYYERHLAEVHKQSTQLDRHSRKKRRNAIKPVLLCVCIKSQWHDMKRFNINLDDSAFTKDRPPVCIFLHLTVLLRVCLLKLTTEIVNVSIYFSYMIDLVN